MEFGTEKGVLLSIICCFLWPNFIHSLSKACYPRILALSEEPCHVISNHGDYFLLSFTLMIVSWSIAFRTVTWKIKWYCFGIMFGHTWKILPHLKERQKELKKKGPMDPKGHRCKRLSLTCARQSPFLSFGHFSLPGTFSELLQYPLNARWIQAHLGKWLTQGHTRSTRMHALSKRKWLPWWKDNFLNKGPLLQESLYKINPMRVRGDNRFSQFIE